MTINIINVQGTLAAPTLQLDFVPLFSTLWAFGQLSVCPTGHFHELPFISPSVRMLWETTPKALVKLGRHWSSFIHHWETASWKAATQSDSILPTVKVFSLVGSGNIPSHAGSFSPLPGYNIPGAFVCFPGGKERQEKTEKNSRDSRKLRSLTFIRQQGFIPQLA